MPLAPLGRPRDPGRDAALLQVTADLLTERGYSGFTVSDVAARAAASKATVYRRWPAKADLVMAAVVAALEQHEGRPDTGSLRGDLTAMLSQMTGALASRNGLVSALVGQLRHDPELAEAFRNRFLAGRLAVLEEIFDHARERGEVSADADTSLLQDLVPATALYRVVMLGEPPDPVRIGRLIDEVIVPLATGRC